MIEAIAPVYHQPPKPDEPLSRDWWLADGDCGTLLLGFTALTLFCLVSLLLNGVLLCRLQRLRYSRPEYALVQPPDHDDDDPRYSLPAKLGLARPYYARLRDQAYPHDL